MTTEAIRERQREAARRYRAKHKETLSVKRRLMDSRPAARAKQKEKNAKYRKENPEKVKLLWRAWAKANPEKVNERNTNRRAKRKNAQGFHTQQEWRDLCTRVGNRCIYCFIKTGKDPVPGKLTRDHFMPLSLGGSNYIDNIVPACHSCKSSKRAKSPTEWANAALEQILLRWSPGNIKN